MLFKNPEVLYLLGLLIIPILIHLFQLQRFQKVPFTNVAFLKKLVLQTRKSSQIKKWLILTTRLLLLTALIFAFAQPYFSNHKANEKQHFSIYLDNSLSTNTKGEKGNLLQIAAQEIIENISEKATYSLLTNTNFYKNKTASQLKETLLTIKNTAKNKNIKDVLLTFSTDDKTTKNILISDFQNVKKEDLNTINTNTTLVKINTEQKNNISIDNVFINDEGSDNLKVNIVIKNQGKAKENIPIAIYNDATLINKQTFSIKENQNETVVFSIVKSPVFLGKISTTFNDAFSFDNSFYFSINTNTKINVLAIGNNNDFLQRIYTKPEFNLNSSNVKNVNYNLIPKQHLIILNELETIPKSLLNSLTDFTKKGGNLIIIPNEKLNINTYNNFLSTLKIGRLISQKNDSLKITTINYNHPLLKNVFEKKVQNFQYPFVKKSFLTTLKNANSIISFENKQNFISQIKKEKNAIYWISAPLNKENSNFINSPLIVPVFYNIGKQSLQHSKLYYIIDKLNTIDIEKQLKNDEVLSIANTESSFIPLQENFQNKIKITTSDNPLKAGFYQIKDQQNTLANIAYNYTKNESLLNFFDVATLQNTTISRSVKDTLKDINNENKIQWLWKWFLALAIVSLLVEILILKFFKP